MTRTMYDSITAADIPTTVQIVAGYVDGKYAWSAADWSRFPGAVKVRVAVFASTNDGQVLDVEPGDATPSEAPGWVRMRRAAGVDPTVYCSAYAWPTVRAAFAAVGEPQPHYWIAHYDGIAEIPPGAVAKQYADPELGTGGHWDLSIVADFWPGVDEGDDMQADEREALFQIREQLCGSRDLTKWPGWPGVDGEKRTLVDIARRIHERLEQGVIAGMYLGGESTPEGKSMFALLAEIAGREPADVDEAALAADLAPLLAESVKRLSDEQLAALVGRVNDEHDRRAQVRANTPVGE